MKNILFLLLGTLLFGTAFASPVDSSDTAFPVKLPFKKKVKYADNHFEVGNYFEALELYQELYEDKKEDVYIEHQMAECYRLARDYKNGVKYYKKVASADADDYPSSRFYYGECLQKTGEPEQAKSQYSKFVKADHKGLDDLSRIAKSRIKACEYAMSYQAPADPSHEIIHLDEPLNQPWTDYAPQVLDQKYLYYSSLNNDTATNRRFMKYGMFLSHIYRSELQTDGTWGKGEIIDRPANSDLLHSGNTAFTPDGQKMYFTHCEDNGNNSVTCKILFSKRRGDEWSTPKELSEIVNKPETDNTHPAVAQGPGRKDLLYFVSDREGGKGGYDIWHVEVDANGRASNLTNLDAANTEDNEYTPYYHTKRKLLYFSSAGLPGFGGYDVFKLRGNSEDGWDTPINMGQPVNSTVDDIYFTAGESKKLFYMVSNRPGIIGLKSETCCDDIFKVKDLYKPFFAVSGLAYEKEDSITLSDTKLDAYTIELYDITSGTPKLIKKASSDASGVFFADALSVDRKYSVKFQQEGYFSDTRTFNTMGLEEPDTFSITGGLERIRKDKAYTLSNIYYAYKSTKLTKDSEQALDELYSLMMENPLIIIELSSHTDSIGSDGYNERLSQKRAQSCVDYLTLVKKVPLDRILAKGYGETLPVAPNSLPNGKDNPDGRAKNRRTEYRIVGELEFGGDKVIMKP